MSEQQGRPVIAAYCAICRGFHDGIVVSWETDGFPDQVRYIGPHQPPLDDALAEMVEAAESVLSIALDCGNWDLAEQAIGPVLELLDPRPGGIES
jgi:hypothetical protein